MQSSSSVQTMEVLGVRQWGDAMGHVLCLTSGNSSEIGSIVDSHLKIDLSDVVTEHFIRIQSAEVVALKAEVELGKECGLRLLVRAI